MVITPFAGCYSGSAEYPSLLGCDAMCFGRVVCGLSKGSFCPCLQVWTNTCTLFKSEPIPVHCSSLNQYLYTVQVWTSTCTLFKSEPTLVHCSSLNQYLYTVQVWTNTCTLFKSEPIHVHLSCKHYDLHPITWRHILYDLNPQPLLILGKGVGQVEPKSTCCAEAAEFQGEVSLYSTQCY